MPYNPTLHHRHSIRLKGYDYSQSGLYFVTICVQKHECLLGEITNGEMILNEYGKIVNDEWQYLQTKYPHIVLCEYVIMPNHFHGIVAITDAIPVGAGSARPQIRPNNFHCENNGNNDVVVGDLGDLGDLGAGRPRPYVFENGDGHPENENICFENGNRDGHPQNGNGAGEPVGAGEPRPYVPTLGNIIGYFKYQTTKKINLPVKFWQRNFHEHIIRNEKSHQYIANYIVNNPAKWDNDKYYIK